MPLLDMNNVLLYPSIDDTKYHSKIKDLMKQIDSETPQPGIKKFNLMKHQKDVEKVFNLFSNTKSLLLLCEMGSGKTITSLNLIENMKTILTDHNTRALILVPNQLIENVFYSEITGLLGDKYEKRVTGNNYVDKDLRQKLNSTTPNTIERKRLEKVAIKRVKDVYEIVTHKKWEQYVLNLSNDEIVTEFSNRIIVVDEIHKAKNPTSNLFLALQKVLLIAKNVWFIGMNAERHIIDDPKELCQYINLMHFNNTKNPKLALSGDVIDSFFDGNQSLKREAQKIIINAIRGLIVFVDGHDPKWFPTRIDIGFDQNQINKMYSSNYTTTVGITKHSNVKIESNSKLNNSKLSNGNLTIKNIPKNMYKKDIFLRPVELKGKSCEDYVYAFMGEVLNNRDLEPNEMWSKSRKYCRCDNVFEAIWNDSLNLKNKGPIVVYCFFVEEGMFLFEEFLKSKGVKPFQEEEEDSQSKFKNGNGEHFFNFSRPYSNAALLKAIKICQHPSNKNGQRIKWILGTKKIGIGITITNASRVCSIGSEWNNYNQDQFFGRCIRFGSHPEDSKIEVIKYCSVLSENSINNLSPLLKAQLTQFIKTNKKDLISRGFIDVTTNHLKTVDEYMYNNIVWEKYKKIYELEMFVKQNAMLSYDLSQMNNGNDVGVVDGCVVGDSVGVMDGCVVCDNVGDNVGHNVGSGSVHLPNIKSLFKIQPIWNIGEIHEYLKITPKNVGLFLMKLDKYVHKQSVFNGWNDKSGYIIYLGKGYYKFSEVDAETNIVVSGVKTSLQEFILPINFWDVLFPLNDLYKYGGNECFVPTTFQHNLFILKQDLRLNLTKECPIAGVFSNTSTHPNTYQFKIVTNETESVCSDKSITEIHNVANKLNIVIPNFKSRKCRTQIVDVVLDGMKNRNLILPWSPNKKPSLLQLYKLTMTWDMKDQTNQLLQLHKKWISREIVKLSEWIVNVLKYQNYWDDEITYNADGTMNIPDTVRDYLLSRNSTNHLYLFKIFDQTNCGRPKRFCEKAWNTYVKPMKKYLHEKYKADIGKIEASIREEINKRFI